MKKEDLFQAMEHIDEEIIENTGAVMTGERSLRGKRPFTGRVVAVAASLVAVFVVALMVLPGLNKGFPVEEFALATGMGLVDNGSHNRYTEAWACGEGELDLEKLPEEDLLPVYRKQQHSVDTEEYQQFLNEYVPRLEELLQLGSLSYEIDDEHNIRTKFNRNGIYAFPSYYFRLSRDAVTKTGLTDIRISAGHTDEEIKEKFRGIIENFNRALSTNFTEIRIERSYGGETGFDYSIEVYEKNNGEPIDLYGKDVRVFKHNGFSFYYRFSAGAQCATFYSFEFYKETEANENCYQEVGEYRRISLEKAEELLNKGYVFSGHACQQCMEMQPKVDFSKYDHVGLEYVTCQESDYAVPVYTFYKFLNEMPSGEKKYAKTQVAAIEVSGLEEYFNGLN